MGWPVVLVDSGGVPVTEASNGLGAPVTIATNGLATAVTLVASGGAPVRGIAPFPAPDGFSWDVAVIEDADGVSRSAYLIDACGSSRPGLLLVPN